MIINQALGDNFDRGEELLHKKTQDESQFEQPIFEKRLSSKQSTKASPNQGSERTTRAREVEHLFHCGTFMPKVRLSCLLFLLPLLDWSENLQVSKNGVHRLL